MTTTTKNASKISSLLNGVYNSVEYRGGMWGVYSNTVAIASWSYTRPASKCLLEVYQDLGDAWQEASKGGRYVLFVNK